VKVRLGNLAYARSGDKGASANVGVIARYPAAFDLLRSLLTCERVKSHLGPLAPSAVHRYELPNLHALNFVLDDVLDGGGSVSLRVDAQGKALGQQLLEIELDIPDDELKGVMP
jgi:hypothetical protein